MTFEEIAEKCHKDRIMQERLNKPTEIDRTKNNFVLYCNAFNIKRDVENFIKYCKNNKVDFHIRKGVLEKFFGYEYEYDYQKNKWQIKKKGLNVEI